MTKQNAFTREDLLRCSRGELFGPGNAQLPAPNMPVSYTHLTLPTILLV